MWIQVRTMDGKETRHIDGLSKLTPVQELREKIREAFAVEADRQRLFYRGKQVLLCEGPRGRDSGFHLRCGEVDEWREGR